MSKTVVVLLILAAALLVILSGGYIVYMKWFAKNSQDQTTEQTANNGAAENNTGNGSEQAGIANPASVNCTENGGVLRIEEKTDGGQFGVCYFDDNRQCEEWAMYRGDCPVGGIMLAGYATEAERFCIIMGGWVNTPGTCTFKGLTCDEDVFYENNSCGNE